MKNTISIRKTAIRDILARQREYWNTLGQAIPDDVAANHWVTAEGRPLAGELFSEIAEFLANEFLAGKEAGSVLEVGCGNGLILKRLSDWAGDGWHFYGVDLSEAMLARTVAERATLYCTDATSIPCPDRSIDLVYLHSVVQYFETEEYLGRVIAECSRLLKLGGALCLMDVPIKWYMDLMSSDHWISRLKRGAKKAAPRVAQAWSRLAPARARGYEKVGSQTLCVPLFQGLYVDPDYFQRYESAFEKISIEIQRFPSKHVSYRKFRFNIALRGKRETGSA
jgi:ubiquinone/menaquinone biosynthesis C-methylase UbiE